MTHVRKELSELDRQVGALTLRWFLGIGAAVDYFKEVGKHQRVLQDKADALKAVADWHKKVADAEDAAFSSGKFWADQEAKNALAAALTADEVKTLNEALAANEEAYQAAVDSSRAYGEVSSVQLANKISEISLALELQKQQLGANSDEWLRHERVATSKIASLKERIENLRQGFGDLKDDTATAADEIEAYGAKAAAAVPGVNALAAANGRLAAAASAAAQASRGGLTPLSPVFGQGQFTGLHLQGGVFTTPTAPRALPNGRLQ